MIKIEEKFYQEENDYNSDIYKEYKDDIKKYINQYKKEEYDEIIKKDKRTNIVNIFSEMKANIIKWYPFDKEKNVLEIGSNYGEISQELIKRCKEVTAVEFSKEKATCISKRLEDANNLKIVLCSNLKKLKLKEKYDYITIIGIAEYAQELGFTNLGEMIKWAYENLKDEGKILFAIDNKFGVKYLAGSTRNKEEVPFANYKTYVNKDYTLYGKTELENMLKQNKITNYKFYYPVPNYNLTHLIYTDEYLPKKSRYNIYYREDEEILFNELTLIDEAIKNEKFDFFTNSYLIELAKNKNEISDVSFVNYSNMRKKQYKIITKITPNKVTKKAYAQEGKNHINQIGENIEILQKLGFNICENKNDEEINSKYIKEPTMDEYLQKLVEQGKIEEFYEELDKWYKFLKENIKHTRKKKTIFEKYKIEITEEQKKNLTMLENGFIDLIFQNVFYDEKEYIVFDQEWYEEPLPLEFLMYRSIKQLFFQYNNLEKKVNKEQLYKKYNIENYKLIFDELEDKWQKEMVDNNVLSFYQEKWTRIISIEDIKYRYNQELGKIYAQRDELQKEINLLKNSRFYKWTRFLSRRRKENE